MTTTSSCVALRAVEQNGTVTWTLKAPGSPQQTLTRQQTSPLALPAEVGDAPVRLTVASDGRVFLPSADARLEAHTGYWASERMGPLERHACDAALGDARGLSGVTLYLDDATRIVPGSFDRSSSNRLGVALCFVGFVLLVGVALWVRAVAHTKAREEVAEAKLLAAFAALEPTETTRSRG